MIKYYILFCCSSFALYFLCDIFRIFRIFFCLLYIFFFWYILCVYISVFLFGYTSSRSSQIFTVHTNSVTAIKTVYIFLCVSLFKKQFKWLSEIESNFFSTKSFSYFEFVRTQFANNNRQIKKRFRFAIVSFRLIANEPKWLQLHGLLFWFLCVVPCLVWSFFFFWKRVSLREKQIKVYVLFKYMH